MTAVEDHPASVHGSARAASRYELLAAVVESEAARAGEPIGYQQTIIDILRRLDDAGRGRMDPQGCLEGICDVIARAVVIDPFDRG